MKGAEVRLADEPEMQRRDIGVADERLWIQPEDSGLEIRQHAHGAVTSGPADDRADPRIEPHAHQTFGAALIFGAAEPAQLLDFGIEDDTETGALERLHAAHEP